MPAAGVERIKRMIADPSVNGVERLTSNIKPKRPAMNSMNPTKRKANRKPPESADVIAAYAETQTDEHAAICRALRAEIDAMLPKATSRLWHAMPVWFAGENPVVGYKATPKHVNLLFWNGQSFGEPGLKTAGKFRAAQIQFTDVSQVDSKALRRWLKQAGTDIWDYREVHPRK